MSADTDVVTDPTVEDAAGAGNALDVATQSPVVVQALSSIPSDDEIGRIWRLAKSLFAARMFKGAESEQVTAEQAFAKILIGRDMGLAPAQALRELHIVKGNVQVSGVQLLAWVRKSSKYQYKIKKDENDNQLWSSNACTLVFYGKGIFGDGIEWEELGESSFTLQEAKDAGIFKPGGGWDKYPKNMCLWRAASNGVRAFCPDLMGGMAIYTEADDFGDSLGDKRIDKGTGDGSEPGWIGLSKPQEVAVEAMLARAEKVGHRGLSDRATMQMRLANRTPQEVDGFLAGAAQELNNMVESTAEEIDEKPEAKPGPMTPLELVVNEDAGVYEYTHPGCELRQPGNDVYGYYEVPLSGTTPVEGQIVPCPGCGVELPVASVRMAGRETA